MGAEVGATTSLFPFDNTMAQYLRATGRDEVASWAEAIGEYLEADMDVRAEPDKFYDRVIVINLSELEPHINGPFTPDAATPISEFAAKVKANGYPERWRSDNRFLYQLFLSRSKPCGIYCSPSL